MVIGLLYRYLEITVYLFIKQAKISLFGKL